MGLSWQAGTPPTDSQAAVNGAAVIATFAPFFLSRLCRLSALKASAWPTPLERRMIDHAMYSTYWDCVRLGVREAALDVLRDTRLTQRARRLPNGQP